MPPFLVFVAPFRVLVLALKVFWNLHFYIIKVPSLSSSRTSCGRIDAVSHCDIIECHKAGLACLLLGAEELVRGLG